MVFMVDFAILILELLLISVTHVLLFRLRLNEYPVDPNADLLHIYCYVTLDVLHLSENSVHPIQICFPCIIMLLELFCTSVHIQWTQCKFIYKINYVCNFTAWQIRQPVI